jgi:putative ATPase
MAFFDALKEVDREDAEVPNHLRDASRDAESFGHGEGYIYPHAYRDHWAAQQYLPTSLRGRTFYLPSIVGYEGKIRQDVLQKRELQAAIVLGSEQHGDGLSAADGELLTWSAQAKGREGWFKRLESGRSALLLSDRDQIFDAAAPSRQDRVLIPMAAYGLILWESLRRCPEGLSAALVGSKAARDALLRYAATLHQIDQPEIAVLEGGLLPSPQQAEEWFSSPLFDFILIREPWKKLASSSPQSAFSALATAARLLLATNGCIIILCSPPLLGERISRILIEECGSSRRLANQLQQAEEEFFSPTTNKSGQSEWNWDANILSDAFESAGFIPKMEILNQKEDRLIGTRDIDAWFDREKSRWGVFMAKTLDMDVFTQAEETLRQRIQAGPLSWKWKSLLLIAR